MYCRMCGNKIDDTDRYCNKCGAPTGQQENTTETTEPIVISEEVVFNPPYEGTGYPNNGLHLAEEEPITPEKPLIPEEPKEELKGFISGEDIEVEAHKTQKAADHAEAVRHSEFDWDVKDFPTSSKKTEDIKFNWKMEEYGPIAQAAKAEQAEREKQDGQDEQVDDNSVLTPIFEEELFQEIRDESNRVKDTAIDRFFTFSKKNEEFQKLLDKEYEKFNRTPEPMMEYFEEKKSEAVKAQAEPEKVQTEPETIEVLQEKQPQPELAPQETVKEEVAAVTEETVTETAAEPEPAAENKEHIAAPKSEMVSEMAQARALFFADDIIKDNETIRKKLVITESVVQTKIESDVQTKAEPEVQAEIGDGAKPDIVPEAAMDKAENKEPVINPETPAPFVFGGDQDEEEDEKKKISIGQILFVIIAIILIAEISILAIRYFAPESYASKAIGNAQTQVIDTVSGWFDGTDSKSTEENSKDVVKPEDKQKDTTPAAVQTTKSSITVPDPNPMEDKAALVASQMGNNVNIQKVQANTKLGYINGKDYGLSDLNSSKPIANNVWLTTANAAPVYYDQSVVGTVIAFDSQWIDYANGTNKSVLDLLKKDSKAYQNTIAYTKIGKVKETFKLLEIGEIRQGANGFYVWAHEEIQITELGKTADKSYNWIYCLEPVNGKMNIVNYFKF